MLNSVAQYFTDVFDLLYPHVCAACSQKLLNGEEVLCFSCEATLPQTGHWNDKQNAMAQRFWGRVELRGAAAFLHFQKGENVQHLLHQLKYRGRKDVGLYLGTIFGQLLKENESIIQEVDLILPVPLHWKKLKQRGYNQCDPFAEGLSRLLNIPWHANAIERRHENISQTKISRFDRYGNVEGIFAVVQPELLKGKHLLLVDDVVTTGATAEACLTAILAIENTTASFASIAVARR